MTAFDLDGRVAVAPGVTFIPGQNLIVDGGTPIGDGN